MKYIFATLLICMATAGHSQTLFTYGKFNVSKDEFLRAYNKNNNNPANTEKAYRDYLQLYIRFKLKVQAAYDARLDTLPGQAAELKNFRNQIVDGFMNDESSVQQLVDEAFTRSQKDIRAADIYIPFRGGDTMAAYHKAMEAYNKIQAGADFGTVAETYSSDPGVHATKGDIGFITAFVLPYELENIVYSTPLGKTAYPYRSKSAYLILKTTAERPALGRMRAAQILIAFLPNADQAEKDRKRKLADSLYTALEHGASFKDLVAKYSNDNISYQAGGLMPEFGTGRYSDDFEQAAFGITKDSAITKPVLTSFGYHIIMRVQRLPVNADRNNKEAMAQLRQQVQADKRIAVAKQIFAQKAMKAIGFARATVNEQQFFVYADSVYASKNPPQLPTFNDKTVLFTLGKQKYHAMDFAKYIRGITTVPELLRGRSTPQLLQQYAETAALENYRDHLENYNKEFAIQLNEFKDGNLLFEIMQRRVWDKAAADSTGLLHFYQAHADKYWWEKSADAILFTCTDSLNAQKAWNGFHNDPQLWKTMVQNSDGTIQADSGRFELSQLNPNVAATAKAGLLSEPLKNTTDNVYSFTYVVHVYDNRMPRSFQDARGFVINDYQSYLEDKWVESLSVKYPVRVNEAVFKTCWQ